ncbi:hypothetical protein [Pseudonocardia xishanensis]|uniref:Uncharacterized protein n=1 Tax=Pseudonocardia xishanensis TaxID=630995 RepID=A0ABP8RCL4_9PSEU
MALFGKRTNRGVPPVPVAPATITDDDLGRLATLLSRFEEAIGSDPRTRAAVLDIATAGGALSVEDNVRHAAATGQADVDQPWRWLGRAAEAAQRRGDWELIAHIGLFAGMFMTSFAPHLTLADQLDMRLSGGSAQSLGVIYTVVLDVLPSAPRDFVVVDHPTGRMTVDNVLLMCAVNAMDLSDDLLSPSAAAQAAAIVG